MAYTFVEVFVLAPICDSAGRHDTTFHGIIVIEKHSSVEQFRQIHSTMNGPILTSKM